MSDAEAVVRRYYGVVADLGSSEDDLRAVLHPAVRVIEHPNLINPSGTERDLEGVVAGFLAGKELLSSQSMELHEALVAGDRVAVRCTWRGTLPDGRELEARIASFLTVADGRVREHETFDCYLPPG